MKIYRPLKTNRLTQRFGENKVCVKGSGNNILYPPQYVSKRTDALCPLGYIPLYQLYNLKGHNGLDFASFNGEKLYHSANAATSWTAWNEVDNEGGIGVDIISDKPIFFAELPKEAGPKARELWQKNGGYIRVKLRYWHLKQSLVKDGQKVSCGDLIGLCDSTGASTGHHLHWGLKFVDENGVTLDKMWTPTHNGYGGAVDFESLLEADTFVLDFLKEQNEQSLNRLTEQPEPVELTHEQKITIFDVILSFIRETGVDLILIKQALHKWLQGKK